MNDELRTHGVREFHENADADDFAAEEIRTLGYTVIDGGLSAEELAVIRERVHRVYETQLREVGGQEMLQRINDADIARCLLGYDDYFVQYAAHPRLVSILRKLLGPNFILMSQNGIINRPKDHHYQVTWHRDLNYQHFVSSKPLAISALYCVDDFSEETGGTWFLPASHKIEAFPSPEYIEKHKVVLQAKAGSILVFDAMLFHRAGTNSSQNTRLALNHIYVLPLIKQQISLPKIMGEKYGRDPLLRMLLGYDSEPADTPQQWRERRLACAGPVASAGAGANPVVESTSGARQSTSAVR